VKLLTGFHRFVFPEEDLNLQERFPGDCPPGLLKPDVRTRPGGYCSDGRLRITDKTEQKSDRESENACDTL